MWTNGSGTSSVKQPLRRCWSRIASRWRAQLRGPSTWPNMIVAVDRSPARCAASCTRSHCAVVTLSGQVGHRRLHRAADVEVRLPGEGGMDAALEADLGRAALPRLLRAADDLLQRD